MENPLAPGLYLPGGHYPSQLFYHLQTSGNHCCNTTVLCSVSQLNNYIALSLVDYIQRSSSVGREVVETSTNADIIPVQFKKLMNTHRLYTVRIQ